MHAILRPFAAGFQPPVTTSLCVAAFAAMATLPIHVVGAPEFVELGTLPGSNSAKALAVNSDGTVVAGKSSAPFRWTEETGMVQLKGLPYASGGAAVAVSADGRYIVGSVWSEALGLVPIRWSPSGWAQRVDFPPPAFAYGAATGVSDNGQVVVGDYFADAFVWSQGMGLQFIGELPGAGSSYASAVSGDGSVVVGQSGTGFIWTSATGMLELGGYPDRSITYPVDISMDGRVAVGYARSLSGGETAAMWRDGAIEPAFVDMPGVTTSIATGTNRDGTVVVGYSEVFGSQRAFVWTPELGAVDLTMFAEGLGIDLAGVRIAKAVAVSADGSTIVGSYYPIDVERAFILRDLPLGDNRCSPCAADFDGDGGVTGGDLAAFMVAYEAGARCADVDDDSVVDGNDVAAFLAAFERGGCE